MCGEVVDAREVVDVASVLRGVLEDVMVEDEDVEVMEAVAS